ncbi:MAG: hypothetical protein L0K38_12290 [Yaniella sp.]|uniref:hypothetical protein n=1 Tax=Yaniella sp. TaxID=2773929 RepID=UPI0026492930|nr:hypothetical protein [Yaniella sp.]MDN6457807.1 hypothetical protein [Yaniella sp.]
MSRSITTGVAAAAIASLALTGCGASASDVPAFEEIEGDMWESMAASEAVAMTAVLPEAMSSDAAIIEEMLGGNLSDLQIYGSLDESATAIRLGEDQEPIMSFFGDEVYVSMDMIQQTMNSSMAEEAELEGKYLDISDDYDAASGTVDVADLLEDMRSTAESGGADEVTGFDFSQLQSEGSYMQLDMESDDTGWFYSIDGEDENAIMNGEAEQFIGLASDREAPRLLEIRDGDTSMDFSWDDEVEIPQRPSEDQLVTEEDVMGMALGQ